MCADSLGTRLFAHGGRVWKTAHTRVVLTPRICKPQHFHKRHVNSKALSKLHASSILNPLESTYRIWSRCGSYLLTMHPFWGACRTTLVWAVFQTLPLSAKSLVPRLGYGHPTNFFTQLLVGRRSWSVQIPLPSLPRCASQQLCKG